MTSGWSSISQRTTARVLVGRELGRRRVSLEQQIAALRAALEAEEEEASLLLDQEDTHEATLASDRAAVAVLRGVAE